MAVTAFHGDLAVKEQALARVRKHIAAGTFRFSPAWGDMGATAMGSVIEGDDPQLYADMLGYPLPLVMDLDSLSNNLAHAAGDPSPTAFAEAWLEKTPVGADLSRIVPEMLIFTLSDPALVAQTVQDPTVEAGRKDILALHRRSLEGETISRKTWQEARAAAVAASDKASDRMIRKAALVVEAAAWPATMRTVLRDTVSARGSMQMSHALNAIGWTDDDEKRVFQLMEAAAEQGEHADIEGVGRVHAVLGPKDPVLAARFRERIAAHKEFAAFSLIFAKFLLDRLAAAPVLAGADV
ncbi:MAG: hypothetical protein H2055_00360 [Sphingopyxis sp.]|nr:hypothetical protein [Sphingopyxis sp.]